MNKSRECIKFAFPGFFCIAVIYTLKVAPEIPKVAPVVAPDSFRLGFGNVLHKKEALPLREIPPGPQPVVTSTAKQLP
jgi:hypothetical protein